MSDAVTAAERHTEELAERAPAMVTIAERWLSIAIAAFLVFAAILALGVAGYHPVQVHGWRGSIAL